MPNDNFQHRPFWERACKDFRKRLTAYAMTLANGSVYDAEDLVQETVYRILKYPQNPELITNPLSYLKSTLYKIWVTKWHKEGQAVTISLDESLSKDPDQKQPRDIEPAVDPVALQILENDELRALVSEHQGQLTAREELLLKLRLEDYSCEEIAAMWGVEASLVRNEWNRLRTKIISRIKKALGLK
ncbi:MAG TPA: sigma-70 family RNA polymerase sigma factor [Blastocatellia bacterium]|nr:sigma-70 family RNA polymerase sigma factor [Blastocatellia bacterium]